MTTPARIAALSAQWRERNQELAATLNRLADRLRDTRWQPFQVRDEINMGMRRVADELEALAAARVEPTLSAWMVNVRDVLSDLVDACYTEGSSNYWRICGLCGMESNHETMLGDQTHEKDCPVDVAERLLRAWMKTTTPLAAEAAAPSPIAPVPLNPTQEAAVKSWAADDRLWTTQDTVEFNLRVFARSIVAAAPRPIAEQQ